MSTGIPNIVFDIASDGLGQTQADIRKVPGLIITGQTVAGEGNVQVEKSYQIFSLPQAQAKGITSDGPNAFAWKHISDFYKKANPGAELWFMLIEGETLMSEALDLQGELASKLLSDAKGNIRVLGVVTKADAQAPIEGALEADTALAVVNAQALADSFTQRYRPLRIVLSGNRFSGEVADLIDYSQTDHNRVAISIVNNDGAPEASIGMLLGRLASIPVQRKLHRVKDGPVEEFGAYFTNGAPIESLDVALNAIHAKNYIIMRSFTGRAGYYFANDVTLTRAQDDFKTLSRGFVMDKILIISYNKMVEFLSDEVPVTPAGKIPAALIKSWQNAIDREIRTLMVETGELSDVKIFIDENQPILTTNELQVQTQALPVGYAEYIKNIIGFTTSIE